MKKIVRRNTGITLYRATGVLHLFPHIDLPNQIVTGIVTYQNKTYMTVTVDVKNHTITVDGDVNELGDLAGDKESYIDLFKHEAKYIVENNLSSQEEYITSRNQEN